ncbi:MAG: WcaF family extracellular polysaccharide biosynthesis acetyltransferase [Fimbriimonadaceae bacterium]
MDTPNGEILRSDAHTGPCFTLGNRVRRALWGVVYTLLFRPTPRPLHGWRAFLLRLFGARLGHGVHIYAKVKVWAPWNLEVDDQAGIADDVNLYTMAKITIGKRVIVSQGAHLCCGTHDFEDPNFPLLAYPIRIGDEAWVAAEAFVGPGVTVGEGAVVGARSVVTKDLPAWTVCAGNPCRPIRPRQMREPGA